jgi:hypothetical protein
MIQRLYLDSYRSSDPGGFRQLEHAVQVRILDLDASDDQLLGLLPRLVVDVQGVDLGRQVTADLI